MRVWLPALKVGTGTDVFTSRLAEALVIRGVDAVVTWFPAWMELLPGLMSRHSPPPGTDLIHGNGWTVAPFLEQGVPVITTVHHLVHDPAFAPYRSRAQAIYHDLHVRRRDGAAIRDAAAVTAVSSYVARTVRDVFGRSDVETVGNWVDTTLYRPQSSASRSGGKLRLLWVGNPSRRKGGDLLARVAARLKDFATLRCVGGLRGDRVPDGEAEGIVWLGRVDESRLIEEYQQCDVLLSLSRYEGFGYTALEAMACGKPVLAFAAGGLTDVVKHGETGLLVPVGDLDSLELAARRLATEPWLRDSLGQASLSAARARSNDVEGYLDIYQRVLHGGYPRG